METKKNKLIYIALIPHRDFRIALRKYADSLVKAGLKNVYQFPFAAPLAQLSCAMTSDELKKTAKSLKLSLGSKKFQIQKTAVTEFKGCNENMNLFGLHLQLDEPNSLCIDNKKIISVLNPPVIGTFLLPADTQKQFIYDDFFKSNNENISILRLGFRAAAAANMFWQPAEKNKEIFYKWKIDKLYWLPKNKPRTSAD
ncbi:MAG: hypothetical protein FWC17_00745 [Treponema sp.]|nr:hypothetical protein [Treponema sp.]